MVSVKAPSEIPSAGWHNKKILVVEDEESNYFLIERMLRKTRVKVSWAKNGIESIQMCKKEHFDMVLMDIRMPVMDGYEATQEIKKIHRDIPIIAQTAFALKGEKEKSLAAGCDGYIAKPIDSYELMSILKEYLEVS
jgi:CheY-like chemotaxis protein